jgi:hypothetical protein
VMQSIPCMLCWCMLAGLHIQGTTTALCVRGVICGMLLMTVGYVFFTLSLQAACLWKFRPVLPF